MANTVLLHPLSLHMVLLSYVRPSASASAGHWYYNTLYFLNQKGAPSSSPCIMLLDFPPPVTCHAKCIVYSRLAVQDMNTLLHYCFFYLQLVEHSLAEFNCPHPKVAIKLIMLSPTLPFRPCTCSGLGRACACVFFSGWDGQALVTLLLHRMEALFNLVGPPKHSPRDEALPSTTPPSLAFGRPINL